MLYTDDIDRTEIEILVEDLFNVSVDKSEFTTVGALVITVWKEVNNEKQS